MTEIEHADHVANADVVDVAAVANVIMTPPPPTKGETKVKALQAVTALLVAFAIVMALGLSIYFAHDRARADDELGTLRKQLAASGQVTLNKLDDQRARDDCAAAHGRQITIANVSYIEALGGLIIVIAENPPGSQARIDNTASGLVAVKAADAAYKKAVADRQTYLAAGQPLPCNISESA